MPYRICKIFEVENGHMLSQHPAACKYPHGHSRQVEVILEASDLDHNGMVCDFKALKQAVADCIDRFDHSLCINSEDPAREELCRRYQDRILVFDKEDPTTEVMARHLYQVIRRRLDTARDDPSLPYPFFQEVKLVRVRVTETRTSWAEYYE